MGQAQQWLEEAVRQHESGKLDEAAPLYERVLRIDPVLTWRALKLDRDIIDLPLLMDFMPPPPPIARMPPPPPIERMPPPPPIERMPPPPPNPPRPKASEVSTITSEPAISANAPAASTVAILFMMKRSLEEGSMRPSDQKTG